MSLQSVSRDVFVYQIDNRMSPDMGNDLDLEITNSNLLNFSNRSRSRHKTKYVLTISDISSLGLLHRDQVSVESFYNRLMLAFNLVFKRPIIATFDIIYSSIQLESESIGVVVGFRETIDEPDILSFFALLDKLDQIGPSNLILVNNIRKSLESYQNVMYSNLPVLIFKDLFNSLELATNADGQSRESNHFDQEVFSLSGTAGNIVRDWREFYNRIKHVDRNSSDLNTYAQGRTNLCENIREVRKTVQIILKTRLLSI